jgi:hypothetical protein
VPHETANHSLIADHDRLLLARQLLGSSPSPRRMIATIASAHPSTPRPSVPWIGADQFACFSRGSHAID